ncbi:A24 family peptidase [Paenibacillus glufosinatiresistens]|uniref:A24 family peptidase n=1 Tax=Paenibacillus glufosinatiresistens TaxID=3070657 RepID=UPI00286E7AED|nr:A24 family peptidase [Paenibacillus sp. YX.27]
MIEHWELLGVAPVLAAALWTDIRSMRIPNRITVPAAAGGVAVQTVISGWDGITAAMAGAGAGLILLLLMYGIGAVGAGDVKLFAAIGAWTGAAFTVQTLLYSLLFGAVIGWGIVLWRQEGLRRLRTAAGMLAGIYITRNPRLYAGSGREEMLRFPFMLAVVPGTLLAMWGA